MGGFIPKGQRDLGGEGQKKPVPGPGAYKIESIKAEPTNPKGNYPPIFGSGNSRFNHYNSSVSQTVNLLINLAWPWILQSIETKSKKAEIFEDKEKLLLISSSEATDGVEKRSYFVKRR